jgi:hypothetical protein
VGADFSSFGLSPDDRARPVSPDRIRKKESTIVIRAKVLRMVPGTPVVDDMKRMRRRD